MKKQKNERTATGTYSRGFIKKVSLAGLMGAVLLVSAGCTNDKSTEQAPGENNEPLLIAENTVDDAEEEVQLKEIPVQVDYSLGAEEILSNYTEEGMSRFKLNYPDTYSMEYALKNIGKTFEGFTGKTIDGKTFSTESLKGSPYVLNFSKTTCPVCEEMTPVAETFGLDEDVPVISLYPVDIEKDVEAFRTKANADKDAVVMVAENNEWLKELAVGNLNIAQVPTLIFVDAEGRISYTYIGKTDGILLNDMKEKAFGNEKLYSYLKTKLVKIDSDGNEIVEVPLVETPAEPAPTPKEDPAPKETSVPKETPTPTVEPKKEKK